MKLVIMLATCCLALMIGACGGSENDSTSATSSSTPNGPTPVPWVDSTAGPTLSPSPYPTSDPADLDVRACQGGDLTAEIAHTNGAAGNNIAYWQFTNGSATACHLQGVPDLTFLDSGDALPAVVGKDPCLWEPDVQCAATISVLLAPGATAELTTTTPNMPATCATTTATLVFGLPDGGGDVPVPYVGADSCIHMVVGRFLPENIVTPTPLPQPDLSAVLHLPDSVTAGTTLEFTVEIRNAGPEPFAFGELCPNYFILIDPQDSIYHKTAMENHSLNCHGVTEIAARTSVTFAMQIDLPDTTPGGRSSVDWMLDGTTYLVYGGGPVLQKTPYTINVIAASGVATPLMPTFAPST
jgi:hypothetical protein